MGLSSRIEHRRTGAGLFDQGPIANLLHTLKTPITGGPYIEKPKIKLAVEPSEFAKKVRQIKGGKLHAQARAFLKAKYPEHLNEIKTFLKKKGEKKYLKHFPERTRSNKWNNSEANIITSFERYLASLNELKKESENELVEFVKSGIKDKEHKEEKMIEKGKTEHEDKMAELEEELADAVSAKKRSKILKELKEEILRRKLEKSKKEKASVPIVIQKGEIPAAPGTKGSKAFELTATSFGKIIAKPQKAEFKSILKNFFSANGYTEFSKVPDVLVTAVNELGLVKHVTPEILDTLKGILNNFRAISTAVPVVAATPEATPIIIRKKTATHTRSVPKKKPPPIKRGTVKKLPKKSKGETPHKKLQKTIKFVI